MSFDSIITIIGLFLAAIAIMPPAKQYIYRMRISRFDIAIFVIVFLLAHYLLLIDVFRKFNLVPHFQLYRYGITSSTLLYLLILSFIIYIPLRLRFGKLPIRNIEQFGKLVDVLLQEKKYGDLIHILNAYFDQVYEIGYKNYDPARKEYPNNRTEKCKMEARNILLRIMFYEPFIDHIVQSHSYIFMKFFEIHINLYDDSFSKKVISKLIKNKESILYVELKNITIRTLGQGYHIFPSNKLLFYFLNDVNKVNKYNIWMPFSDYAYSIFEEQKMHPSIEYYNTYKDDFENYNKFDIDVYVTIKFLNILISQSFHQNVYIEYLVKYYSYIFSEVVSNNDLLKMAKKNNLEIVRSVNESLILYMILELLFWIESTPYIDIEDDITNIEELSNKNKTLSEIFIICPSMLMILFNSKNPTTDFKIFIFHFIFDTYDKIIKDNMYPNIGNMFIDIVLESNRDSFLYEKYLQFIIDIIENKQIAIPKDKSDSYCEILSKAKILLEKANKRYQIPF